MRMMIPKKREISGTDVLYIVVVDHVGLTNIDWTAFVQAANAANEIAAAG
jgi:hypothetical protein